MSELEIEKTWVISTSHMSQDDEKYLGTGLSGLCATSTKHWTLLVIPEDEDVRESEKESLEALTFEFQQLYTFAAKSGFHNIKFDSDGPVVPGYPTFDW